MNNLIYGSVMVWAKEYESPEGEEGMAQTA